VESGEETEGQTTSGVRAKTSPGGRTPWPPAAARPRLQLLGRQRRNRRTGRGNRELQQEIQDLQAKAANDPGAEPN
jgi:hypothetical protein